MRLWAKAGVVAAFLLFSGAIQAEILLIRATPPFATQSWGTSQGANYLFAEVETILHRTGTLESAASNLAQEKDFCFIRPAASVTFTVTITTTGTYIIWTRILQHGNSSPTARVSVDGVYQNRISGTGWWKTGGSGGINLTAGNHTLTYIEDATGDSSTWPYRLCAFDVIALSNNLAYVPPAAMPQNVYTPTDLNWYERPFADLSPITVTVSSKQTSFTSNYTGYDLLLLNAAGGAQETTTLTPAAALVLTGSETLNNAAVTPASQHQKRYIAAADLLPRDRYKITPNNDMLDDQVTLSIPGGLTGAVRVEKFDGTLVKQLPAGTYTWDGRDATGAYALKGSYVLNFDPEQAGNNLYAVVYSDPTVTAASKPRVLAISPNGDGVYDQQEISMTGFSYNTNPADQVVVRRTAGNLVAPGPYSIEILTAAGNLRTGSRFDVLNRPATTDTPWLGDFLPLGVWYTSGSGTYLSTTFADLANHSNNAAFYNGWLSNPADIVTRLNTAQAHNLKMSVNLAPLVDAQIFNAIQAPSEPQLEAIFQPYIDAVKNHPATLCYYLADEPSWNDETACRLRAAQQVLGAMDPAHPAIYCNIGLYPRNQYATVVKPKVLNIDVYPKCQAAAARPGDFNSIFHNNAPYGEMLEYIDDYQAKVADRGARTWIFLQAHAFSDQLSQPTPNEIRSQLWLCLTRGIKGFFFFIYQTEQTWIGLDQYPAAWTLLGQTYARLQPFTQLLLHWQPVAFPAWIEGGGNPYGYAKGELGALSDCTFTYLVIANRDCVNTQPITVRTPSYNLLLDLETGTTYLPGVPISVGPGDGRILRVLSPDLNLDALVNAPDLTTLAAKWGNFGPALPGDLDADQAVDIADWGRFAAAWTAADTTPPAAPSAFVAAAITDSSLDLSWNPASDNIWVTEYKLYRNGIPTRTLAGLACTETGLAPTTTYTYQLKARDAAGNESAPATLAVTTLTPPTNYLTNVGVNVGFESESPAGEAATWQDRGTNTPVNQMYRDTTVAYQGAASFRVTGYFAVNSYTFNQNLNNAAAANQLGLISGQNYRLSVWCKSASSGGSFYAYLNTPGLIPAGNTKSLTGLGDWSRLDYDFTTQSGPATNGYLRLYYGLAAGESAWFDTLSLTAR